MGDRNHLNPVCVYPKINGERKTFQDAFPKHSTLRRELFWTALDPSDRRKKFIQKLIPQSKLPSFVKIGRFV